MHLLPGLPTASHTSVVPLLGGVRQRAANDSGVPGCGQGTRHVNALVAGIVGQVAARVQPKNVNIQLSLAPGDPTINSDPGELAFVVGAVLGAALRAVDEDQGENIGVHVSAARRKIRIFFSTDGVPPLQFVRALASGGAGHDVDPTLAHCRRLVEARGGALVLSEQGGQLGFAIELPHAHLSPRASKVNQAVAEFGALRAA